MLYICTSIYVSYNVKSLSTRFLFSVCKLCNVVGSFLLHVGVHLQLALVQAYSSV